MGWPRFRCRGTQGGRLSSAGQGAATARRVARWTAARSGGDGWVARTTQRGEKAVDGRGVRHDRAHRHAPCAPGAARDVHVEGAAQEGGPIDAGKRRVELAAKESVPVRDGQDVRGHAAPTAPAPAARCARRRRTLARLSPRPRSSCASFSWKTTSCILPAIRAGATPRALAMGGAAQAPRAAGPRYRPPRGGASKTIAGPDTSPRYLQLVGDLVYYATDKSIHVMSRSAADASTTRIVLERPAATTVTSFVLITGTLFYTQGSTLRDASSPPPASAVGSTSRKKTRAPRGAPSHQAPTGRGLRMTRKFCRRTWGT